MKPSVRAKSLAELFIRRKMKNIVLIDGENLAYALRKYDSQTGGSGARDFLSLFDYRGMIEEIFEDVNIDEIIWFGAKIKVSKENKSRFKEKVEGYVKNQGRMVNHLTKQKITFKKVGYLRDRNIGDDPQEFKLVEKGVDRIICLSVVFRSAPKFRVW